MVVKDPIQFGIAFGTLGVEWSRLRELWLIADELGFSDGWVPDHFYGYFADRFDLRTAYWVLFPCYLYLVFYAQKGHQLRKWGF